MPSRFKRAKCTHCKLIQTVLGKEFENGTAVCKKCKRPLNPNLQAAPAAQPVQPAPQVQTVPQTIVVTQTLPPSGSFKKTGVLCMQCKTVNSMGVKKCTTCTKKLKVRPSTVIYYDGQTEAIQCQKCGGYTDHKSVKCQKCGKKIKL